MFIGHFGVGLAVKRATPRLSLGTLFLAAQWLDLIWPVFVLTGIERVRVAPGATVVTPLDFEYYPWSHSLLMVLVWAILFVAVLSLLHRGRLEALAAGLLVVSHWALDWLTHRADLPLWPGSTAVGLGLWNSLTGTLLVEVGLFALGVWLYWRSTRALDRRGRWAFWALVAFLALVHSANVFGPPPPADLAGPKLAAPALAMWLLVAWGYWIDRHRVARACASDLHDGPAG